MSLNIPVWLAVLVAAVSALVAWILPAYRRFQKGIAMLELMNSSPDAFYQDYLEHPFFHVPLPIVPSQTFLIHPALIKKMFATPALDYIQVKRELDISVFRMPLDCLPTSGPRSQTLTAIEHMFHSELSPARFEDVMHRFTDQIYHHVDILREEVGPEGAYVNVNARIYDIMFLSAVTAFFGPDFPSATVIKPLQTMATNLAAAALPGQLRWPLDKLAVYWLGTIAQDAFAEVAEICRVWLRDFGTSKASEMVIRTEAMASASGWKDREMGIMLGMLMVTLIGMFSIFYITPLDS